MTDGVQVRALFCDEVRAEANDKLALMGIYGGTLHLLDAINDPVDRLGIAVSAEWPRSFQPDRVAIRLQLPREEQLQWDLPGMKAAVAPEAQPSEFNGFSSLISFNIRVLPLQVGDVIDVWLVINGQPLPAGRLRVAAAEQRASGG